MTPKEMGAALGAGWELHGTHWTLPYRSGLLTVRPYSGPHPWVVLIGTDHGTCIVHWSCPTPEAAVAAAHLLVAVEEAAAGGPLPRLCGEDCTTEREKAEERGRMIERRRVVAWLRRQIGWSHPGLVAAGIERGEHWVGHQCKGERCDGEDRT